MKKLKNKLFSLDLVELQLLCLKFVLCGVGFVRGFSWVEQPPQLLQESSPMYNELSNYIDMYALGIVLMLSSTILFFSEFIKTDSKRYWFETVSLFISGIILTVYGLVSVETAQIIATYYTNLIVATIHIGVGFIGVIKLWKIKAQSKYQ